MSLQVLSAVPAPQVRATPPEALRRKLQERLKVQALSGRMAEPRRFVPQRDGYWDDYGYAIDPAFPELARQVAQHRAGA